MRSVIKRIVHLIIWVKDNDRLNEIIEFDSRVTIEYFLSDIQEASFCFECRKAHKKV